MDQAYIVYLAIICLIVLLYTEVLRASVSFLVVTIGLLLTGVLNSHDLLSGFANEQLAIIIMLLIISNMISKSGITDSIFKSLSKNQNTSPKLFSLKMMGGVGISSAFFNNTPLVALFMPYVHKWSRANNYSPSKLLIPLSYASILGGCITLIGTSTNLIVNGLAVESGWPSLEIFDFALVGGVMMVVGVTYLYFIAPKLLPERVSVYEDMMDGEREYFVEAIVKANSILIGKSIEEAGLRNLKGMYLVEIMRNETAISPVSPMEKLKQEDVLLFAGDALSINDLRNPKLGLSLPKACNLSESKSNQLLEVVVAPNSRLVSKSVRDSDFRGRYDGGILAVHRNGERITGKIGDIELKAGDLLLVLAGNDFILRTRNNPGLYLLNEPEDETSSTPTWKPIVLILGLITAIILSFAAVPLFESLASVLCLGVLLNISSPTKIRNSVDFNLLIIIALGLALGKSMIKSGASDQIVTVLGLDQEFSPLTLLFILFMLTNILASFVTSKAAVAITLPLALQLINAQQLEATPFILIIAFGGAANFMTPIGYQTNLMVYGPGRYKFSDFLKIGLPLTLIYAVVSSVLLAYSYNLV